MSLAFNTPEDPIATVAVVSAPSVGVSYFWSPEPVSGQGTPQAQYDSVGPKTVTVTILATGCSDSCEAMITYGGPIHTPDALSPLILVVLALGVSALGASRIIGRGLLRHRSR